jgi:hypothetical protein
MRQFRYGRDPLFLLGCAAYALNRWGLKPHVHNVFLHGYFNDLWLIPCALPPILWIHRKLRLRAHDRMPGWGEILSHLIFWSVLFEYIGPKFMPGTTGDPWDVAAYCAGGLAAGFWWHRPSRLVEQKRMAHEL